MKIFDFPQYSPEWYQVRLGIPSSSCFDSIVTTKGEQSKQRTKYMYKLAGERISGKAEETYQNAAMLRGLELEAEAREFYSLVTGNEVTQVGFCLSDGAGCSPDGLVGDDAGLEIKCPNMSTHIGYLIENKLPTEYFQQDQGSMLITGRKRWTFMSYYPGIKPLIIEVERDERFLAALHDELGLFCEDLDRMTEHLRNAK